MTQGDQEEAANSEDKGLKKNDQKEQQSSRVESRFKNYEILLNIENEDKIKVPKDLGASVRALKQLLEHPTTIRDPVEDLSKTQIPIRKNIKFDKLTKKPLNEPTNKLTQINQVLDDLREQNATIETNLIDMVYNEKNPEFFRAKKMLDRAQKKYDQIKQESLGRLFSPREKNNIRFNFERTRTDLNEKMGEEK
ncbi:X-ray radiation resistance-associated 1-like [Brachionus plicatilis]|uniref:X-ray radiation resistance-associated 1-like n=1 Tax=Brachionus plicatilis TaxID=10195 RepID=A0A3M7QIZ4_BRAPC|nr:X-ray radiation resistance-associated 1-like [Brachionus plicatilis]